ncbi:MAG: hypothetical protein CME66_06080 [Halobacteriovoraceae bacterium]|jgi:hypothetical protein|nr:hypothetical protein [Halobacteriovoraceae bacterium]|tara:strand:+ start:742 stop:1113 length:372 start_codon:yes stop_codon:yes gene_type:complete
MKQAFLRFISIFKRSKKSVCSICCQIYPDKQLTLVDEYAFCPQDLKLYNKLNWTAFLCVKSSPEEPENSVSIYKQQKKLITKNIPSFIKVDYQQNKNKIISTFTLFIPTNMIQKAFPAKFANK